MQEELLKKDTIGKRYLKNLKVIIFNQ